MTRPPPSPDMYNNKGKYENPEILRDLVQFSVLGKANIKESEEDHPVKNMMDEQQTSHGLAELRNRAAGAEPENEVRIYTASEEAEGLLLCHGDLGEVLDYIYWTKKARWGGAEPVLLENASAATLLWYMNTGDFTWPEAFDVIEERFQPDCRFDLLALSLNSKYLPDNLFQRLVERTRLEGSEQTRHWFD